MFNDRFYHSHLDFLYFVSPGAILSDHIVSVRLCSLDYIGKDISNDNRDFSDFLIPLEHLERGMKSLARVVYNSC